MISLCKALFRMFFRKPWIFIIMTLVSIGFSYVFSSVFQTDGMFQAEVPIYVEETVDDNIVDTIEQSTSYAFTLGDQEHMEDRIRSGKAEFGVILRESDFTMIVGVDSQHVSIARQFIRATYEDHVQSSYIIDEGARQAGKRSEEVEERYTHVMEQPLFTINFVQETGLPTEADPLMYHAFFGMTLFFVIYTIAFNVVQIIIDKGERIWDRMILSPLKRWEMYAAHIVYSFILGYAQVVLIFIIFRFVVGIPFYGQFVQTILLLIPYVFTIVALAMFITGISKNVQHFNTIISIIAVVLAMIGGAFWPLEIVSSSLMLTLSKFVPITYGMEILEGTVMYGERFSDVLYPVSVLVFMGVIFIGIGIHLIERKHV